MISSVSPGFGYRGMTTSAVIPSTLGVTPVIGGMRPGFGVAPTTAILPTTTMVGARYGVGTGMGVRGPVVPVASIVSGLSNSRVVPGVVTAPIATTLPGITAVSPMTTTLAPVGVGALGVSNDVANAELYQSKTYVVPPNVTKAVVVPKPRKTSII